jgi:hypothetical protein
MSINIKIMLFKIPKTVPIKLVIIYTLLAVVSSLPYLFWTISLILLLKV